MDEHIFFAAEGIRKPKSLRLIEPLYARGLRRERCDILRRQVTDVFQASRGRRDGPLDG